MRFRSERGFTLIELLMSMAIIFILSAMGVMSYVSYRMKAETTKAVTTLRNAMVALEAGYETIDRSAMLQEDSASNGAPLNANLANALPGMNVSEGVMLRLRLFPCGGINGNMMVMMFSYACEPNTYSYFFRTCGGMDILRLKPGVVDAC